MTDPTALISAEVEHLGLKPLASDPASSLRADLHLDGAHIAHLAMMIEDALDCRFMDEVVQGWASVADVLATVAKVRAERSRALDGLMALDGDLV